jgi:hypothetical protein
MLVLPNREVWTFDAYEERVELEESVYLAGPDGPRRAVQIVIHGHARQVPRVHWTFAHQDAQEPVRRASARSRNCRYNVVEDAVHRPRSIRTPRCRYGKLITGLLSGRA